MSIQDMVREKLEETEEDEELLDFVSEDEDEGAELEMLEIKEPPPKLDKSFPTTLVICDTPKVGEAKYEKLMGVLQKLLDKHGHNERVMPMNSETGMTEGVCFVTWDDKQTADTVASVLDGFALDKNHVFKVVKMDTFEQIVNLPDVLTPQRTLTRFSRSDFRTWLADKKCREQILLRYQTETEIYWHDTMAGAPVLCYGGEREKAAGKVWCDWRVQWSPQGSYIATFHAQGIALWAGPEFQKKCRLPHKDVKEIQFSPTEEYCLLWNGAHPAENDDSAVRIFHVFTGECVKRFKTPPVVPSGEDFPHFLWSADGKFFAECNESRIFVRDTDSFELLKDETGKRSPLKYESLSTFQWSPKDNLLAVWTLEKDNNPARLVLIEIPSRRELRSLSRTQCEATMHWQSEGDYLCLLVTKLSKTKKKMGTNLEILRIRERSIPVENVTVNDCVRGFYWETKGSRFAILTADEAGHKPKLLIYQLGDKKCEELCSFDLPSNSFDSLFWAPDGQYFVVAAMRGQGDLLFAGLNAENRLEILHKEEHYMVNQVTWDPSSRYVITAVTEPMQKESGGYKYAMETGYAIWTFQGRALYRQQKEKFYQISWRPHPPSLLPPERQQHVRKNIKQFSKLYDGLDEQAKETARQAFRREREEKMGFFQEILDRVKAYKDEHGDENGWNDAVARFTEAQDWTEEKTVSEELLGTTEQLISG